MPNNAVSACMLYVAADPMNGFVTLLPFVKCTTVGIKNYNLFARI